MNLPPVSESEMEQARAYTEFVLKGGAVPEGEAFYLILACYRKANPDFLRGLVRQEEPKAATTFDVAFRSFCSDICPACGGTKRPRRDWFCASCWRSLPRAFTSKLWHGFRPTDLPDYLGALNMLRDQGRKPAEAVHG